MAGTWLWFCFFSLESVGLRFGSVCIWRKSPGTGALSSLADLLGRLSHVAQNLLQCFPQTPLASQCLSASLLETCIWRTCLFSMSLPPPLDSIPMLSTAQLHLFFSQSACDRFKACPQILWHPSITKWSLRLETGRAYFVQQRMIEVLAMWLLWPWKATQLPFCSWNAACWKLQQHVSSPAALGPPCCKEALTSVQGETLERPVRARCLGRPCLTQHCARPRARNVSPFPKSWTKQTVRDNKMPLFGAVTFGGD